MIRLHNLIQYVFDRTLFFLECMQYVQKRLVCVFRVMLETLLYLGHVGDSLVKSRRGGRLLVFRSWSRSAGRDSSDSLQIEAAALGQAAEHLPTATAIFLETHLDPCTKIRKTNTCKI